MTNADRIGDGLRAASRALRTDMRRRLEPLGLTPSQTRALRTVLHHEPLRMSELARHLGIVPRSATSVVEELVAVGLVERRPAPDDRRATLVTLTDRGRSTIGHLDELRRAGLSALTVALSPAEVDQLAHLLGRLVLTPGDDPATPGDCGSGTPGAPAGLTPS